MVAVNTGPGRPSSASGGSPMVRACCRSELREASTCRHMISGFDRGTASKAVRSAPKTSRGSPEASAIKTAFAATWDLTRVLPGSHSPQSTPGAIVRATSGRERVRQLERLVRRRNVALGVRRPHEGLGQ